MKQRPAADGSVENGARRGFVGDQPVDQPPGKRRLDLEIDEAELAKRRALWKPPTKPARGYARLYAERVTQADKGCDFDFLAG